MSGMQYARLRRSQTRKKDIKIRLDNDLARQLDTLAETLSVSRGSILERALDLYLTLKAKVGEHNAGALGS